MPLIGAHVSIAGGLVNAPGNAAAEGCECFQLFTRSPRGGAALPITPDDAARFRDACATLGLATWVVHAPYYINLASESAAMRASGVRIIREELERASAIGAMCVMVHLGSAKAVGEEQGIAYVIQGLTKALTGYTGSARFCIEIAAGAGAVMGGTFEEIATIIAGVEQHLSAGAGGRSKRKSSPSRGEGEREGVGAIGVCFDTQHAFAAGYDLRTAEGVDTVLQQFDRTIGLDRLLMSHIQDSKVECGAQRDRHEHIGEGHIGINGLAAFVQHPAIRNLPLILETEPDKRATDIALLKGFR